MDAAGPGGTADGRDPGDPPRLPRALLLMRHARPERPSDDVEDADRPLTLAGRRDAVRVARWVMEKGLVPDFVVASPSTRTEETVMRLLETWEREDDADDPDRSAWPDAIYGATLSDLLQALAEVPAAHRRVLLVGHNPSVGVLLRHLCGSAVRDGTAFSPGTLAAIRMPRDWTDLPPGCGELAGMVDPEEL